MLYISPWRFILALFSASLSPFFSLIYFFNPQWLYTETNIFRCVCKIAKNEHYVILFSNLMHYFFIKSIVFPYMFREILCSSSGGLNCIYTASGS